jgi:hypothetical protein
VTIRRLLPDPSSFRTVPTTGFETITMPLPFPTKPFLICLIYFSSFYNKLMASPHTCLSTSAQRLAFVSIRLAV